jgi:hypothetical protein
MIEGAVQFNQSLITWDVRRVLYTEMMLRNAPSISEKHALELADWPLQDSVKMEGMFDEI